MAEEKLEPREINFRQWLPWTQLFRGFWVALDHKKLLLAAAGILVMACGWWLLASAFYSTRTVPPEWQSGNYLSADKDKGWAAFKEARNHWNLLHETAGTGVVRTDANDLADSLQEFEVLFQLQQADDSQGKTEAQIREILKGQRPELASAWLTRPIKPAGRLRTMPWFEDRGPNQFLLLTGKAGHRLDDGTSHYVPWQKGEFYDWFLKDQVPVLIEPLVKFLRPVFYLLHPNAGYLERFYFLLVIAWTVTTWALFGGAITRLAAIEVARNEKIGWREALRFTFARWRSYLFASFAPLLFIAGCVVLLMLFGLINLIPVVAEFWDGLLWWLPLGLGLVMAVILVGLVGWPMIHATLGAEGSDSFDALSRCYSYVLQKPWNYLGYVVVALCYGAVVVFFVGFMGSLMVYLGKWGVSHTPFSSYTNRDPSYMFVYAPTSFHWRDLLLQGSPVASNGVTDQAIDNYVRENFRWWNYIGAGLIWFWLSLVFLMIIGFGYSYFWSASTIIYLLMRQKVDDTELDEVYLEEEDSEDAYSGPVTSPAAAPPPATGTTGLQMVEPPSLRTPAPAAPAPASAPAQMESAPPNAGDGNGGGESS